MRIKILETGEIVSDEDVPIEILEYGMLRLWRNGDCEYLQDDDYQIIYPPYMDMWITRCEIGYLDLHFEEPTKEVIDSPMGERYNIWHSKGSIELNEHMFPEVTYENSPQEIRLSLTDKIWHNEKL